MAITPNKDQVKGELKDLGGKIQEEAGKLVGSEEQQRSGLKKEKKMSLGTILLIVVVLIAESANRSRFAEVDVSTNR